MEPHLAINRYAELKKTGLDTFEIIRYLRQEFALSIGQAKEIMIQHETGQSLSEYQETLVEPLIRAFEDVDLPESKFEIDDEVETVGDQHTFRRGLIRDRIWHHKANEWHYYLEVDGKRVSKRYTAADLKRKSEQVSGGNGEQAR